MQVQKTVFISYRRTNAFHAIAIHQALSTRGYEVFIDYQNIDSGAFGQIILNQIAARAHFLALLTPSSFKRTVDPNDWYRREIEHALDLKRNVIPLMFDQFKFETVQEYLTGKLKAIEQYNGINIYPDFFDEAIDRLDKRFLKKPLNLVLHPVPNNDQAMLKHFETNEIPAPTIEQLKFEEYFEKGVAAYDNGTPKLAIDEFTRAILFQNNFPDAYYRRGHAHRIKGNIERAIKDWEEAVTLVNTDNPRRLLYLSNIHRLKGDYELALKVADQAIKHTPKDPELFKERAEIHREAGNYEAAIADNNEALRINPEYAHAYSNRGLACHMMNKNTEAIADFDKALSINPKSTYAYLNRGLARYAMNDYKGAEDDFDEAIRLDIQLVWAYLNRGDARYKLGNIDGAEDDFTTALNIQPDFHAAKENLERIQKERDRKQARQPKKGHLLPPNGGMGGG